MADSKFLYQKEDFKELTCSLCAKTFDDGKHQAKYLPCLDSYCKSCLQRLVGEQSTLNCPTCHKDVILPGNCDSLPSNFLVENLKKYHKILNSVVSCDSCDDFIDVVSFCHDCGCFLCQQCVDNHQKMRILRHHKLSTMAELRKQKYNPIMQQRQRCKKHPQEHLDTYCKEARCEEIICAKCRLVEHHGHDLVELDTVMNEVVITIQQSISKVKDKNMAFMETRAEVESLKNTVTEAVDQREKEMKDTVQTLHDLIDSRYNMAHSHMTNLRQIEMNRLTENIESINFLSAQIASACEFADNTCDTSQPTQILEAQKQIMKRLHELETAKLPEKSMMSTSNSTDFPFTEKHHSAMANMQESMSDLCKVQLYQSNCDLPQIKVENAADEKPMSIKKRMSFFFFLLISGLVLIASVLLFYTLPHGGEIVLSRCTFTIEEITDNSRWLKATMHSIDYYGQKVTTGGAQVEIDPDMQYVDILSRYVEDNKDGTYSFYVRSLFKPYFDVKINDQQVSFHIPELAAN